MAEFLFFTNHLHVMTAVAEEPDLRLREIARKVGISERATHRIICELEEQGYISRTRVGARNRYEVHPDVALRHPVHARYKTGQVIRLLTSGAEQAERAATNGAVGNARDELFCAAFAAAPAGMAVADASGRFVAVNGAYCEILGYSQDELIGHSFREFTHTDDIADAEAWLSALATGERADVVREMRYVRRNGKLTWVKLRVVATTDPTTREHLLVAHVVDISERRRQEQALALAEERFNSAFDNAPIGMALVAPEGRWLKVNRALLELIGYGETELLVGSFQSITHPDDLDTDLAHVEDVLGGRQRAYQLEKRYYHADGHIIWVMLSVSLVRDTSGEPLYFIAQIEDISERKEREQALQGRAEQLAILASSDPLTGLANRRAWDVTISEQMRGASDASRPLSLALVDLDGLNEINVAHGHHAGDDALRAVAAALRAAVRDSDLVARVGGDEFAILLPEGDEERMLALTERILETLPDTQSASAGVASWDGHESATALLERADQALCEAKRAGKGRLVSADKSAVSTK